MSKHSSSVKDRVFFPRGELNLGVHRTGIAMSVLLVFEAVSSGEMHLLDCVVQDCTQLLVLLVSCKPHFRQNQSLRLLRLWKTWGYLVCLEVPASALSFSPGIWQVSVVRGFLLMLCVGKIQPSAVSGLS